MLLTRTKLIVNIIFLYSSMIIPQNIAVITNPKLYLSIDDYIMFGYNDFCIVNSDFKDNFKKISVKSTTLTDAQTIFSEFWNNGREKTIIDNNSYFVKPNEELKYLTKDELKNDEDVKLLNEVYLSKINRKVAFECINGERIDANLATTDYSDQIIALSIIRGRIFFKNSILSQRLDQFSKKWLNYDCLIQNISYEIDHLLLYHNQSNMQLLSDDLGSISNQEYERLKNNNYISSFTSYNNPYGLDRIIVQFFIDNLSGLSDGSSYQGYPSKNQDIQQSYRETKATIKANLIIWLPRFGKYLLDSYRGYRIAIRATQILNQIGEVRPIPFNNQPSIYSLMLRKVILPNNSDCNIRGKFSSISFEMILIMGKELFDPVNKKKTDSEWNRLFMLKLQEVCKKYGCTSKDFLNEAQRLGKRISDFWKVN